MQHSRLTHTPIAFALLLVLTGIVFGQDGPPGDFGPTDPHRLSPIGLNQKVLVIYVQASDFQILPADLAGLNTTMDTRRNKVSPWFQETTYNQLTVDMVPRRTTTNAWYTLPGTLLEYVRPNGVRSMQARSAASATAVNPTPATSVTGTAAATAGSQFVGADAGNYRYAVSTFRNGQESQLTKVAGPIAVAAGDAVTLTITRAAAADADRFLVYRTFAGSADVDNNYFRIGQVNVTGTTANFTDNGIKLDNLGDWYHILTHAMEAADPDVPDFDIFKGVLVVIFSPFLRGQAGEWTFTINGSPINMSGVYLASDQDFGRYTHEMGHWIGLPDLYDPVGGFSLATWDTMDCACDGQFQTWEKDFLLHHIVNPANVLRLIRPAPGNPDLDQDFIIHPTEIADTFADRQTALKIKASDTVHYYIEGRRHIAGNTSDQATPNQNIVITEAIDVLPMGIIPRRNVRLLRTLNAGDPFFSPEAGDAVQITFTSINNPGGDESYNVHVKLKAQPQPDPKITPWSPPPWESPDIWVDSSREGGGFQDPATATPLAGNGEHAWVNHENRVWAKITNVGDGPANNVTVRFKVNTPGGMGDAGQFVDLPTPAPINLAPHESKMVFAPWTPTVGSHTCIKVEVDHIVGEADINNNFAQENISDFYTGSSSPWHELIIPMDVANPFPEAKRVDIQVAGLPAGWRAKVEHLWVNLDARGRKMVQATITPPANAPECTAATLNVYAQTRIDDFIQPYSGFTPVIHLANPIKFRNTVERLDDPNRRGIVGYRVSGCTIPAQANTEIAIQLEGPGGQTTVVFVTTDAAGCFNTVVTFPFPGEWRVRTYFRGSKCNAPTESDPTSVQVPPGGGGFNPLARGLWYSFHLGHNFPLGSFRKTYNSGPSVTADLEYAFNDRLSLYWMLGYHYFNGKTPGVTDLSYTNLSLNLRSYFPAGAWRGYVQAGPGVYNPNFGPTKGGFNVGAGLNFPIQPKLVLELGTDFHFVDPGGANRAFVDPKLGIKFRF